MWVGICCDDVAEDKMISRLYRLVCSPTISSAIHVAFFPFDPYLLKLLQTRHSNATDFDECIECQIKIASNLKSRTMEYI